MNEFKDALRPNCFFINVIAEKCGIPAALIFSRIVWSVKKHKEEQEKQFFIKGKWWMYETRQGFHEKFSFISEETCKRALSSLRKANLIFHMRIRAKDWNQTNFYSINFDEFRKLLVQNDTVALQIPLTFEVLEKLKVQFDLIGSFPQKAIGSKRPNREGQNEPIERVKMSLSSLSNSLTNNLTKRGEGKSPANQSQNQEKKTESETEISELSPKLSDGSPDEGKLLAIDWLRRTDRLARMRGLTESEVLGEIVKLATKYSLAELRQIFDYLESSPVNSKICKEFITPFEASNIFRLTGMTMIEQAYIEAYESPEGKILLKKKNETKPKETPKFLENIMQREQQKLNEKIRLMKEKESLLPKDISKGRLCLKSYPS